MPEMKGDVMAEQPMAEKTMAEVVMAGMPDWQGVLDCAGLAGLTELNGLAFPADRRDAVLSSLARVKRRETTAHIDLR